MKTKNNSMLKPSRQGRCALLRAIWPVILAFTLFALPAESEVITIDPGAFPDSTDLTNAYDGVTLIAEVPTTPGSFVTNFTPPSERTQFIIEFPSGGLDGRWTDEKVFRAEFSVETAFVSVDIQDSKEPHIPYSSTGVLEAYDSGGVLLETVSSIRLIPTGYQTLSITRTTNDIAFIRAYGTGSDPDNSVNISLLTYITYPLFGWVWMVSDSDFGYSQDEDDLLYFLSFGPVWYYNTATSQWSEEGPAGWVYVDWPFYYEPDPGHWWFVLPPADGLWVFYFKADRFRVLPQIIPW
ncbi:MAG: hypothetical protein ACYS6K_05235 [Planctomycetota bacterium]